MQASLTSTKSFLAKTGKIRALHRRQRSTDSAASTTTQADVPSASFEWDEGLEPVRLESDAEEKIATIDEIDNTTYEVTEVDNKLEQLKRIHAVFEGLPDYRTQMRSGKSLIDDDYLHKAFGITMDRTNHSVDKPSKSPFVGSESLLTPPPEEDEDIYEMDVGGQSPELGRSNSQVLPIPSRRTPPPPLSHMEFESSGRPLGVSAATTSLPSTSRMATRATAKQKSNAVSAHMSIVSPPSVVEMPRPRRPFSPLTIEGTAAVANPMSKSAASASSDGTSEQGGKSATYSPRSSMSSVYSENGLSRSEALRGPSHSEGVHGYADETHLLQAAVVVKAPKPIRINPPIHTAARGPLRQQISIMSLQSNSSTVDTNKPLPPEPPRGGSKHTPSRSSSLTVRQGSYAQIQAGDGSVRKLQISKKESKGQLASSSSSLRSKYTPKDLAALDDAFQRTTPAKSQVSLQSISYSKNSTPSQSQISLNLDGGLSTIPESAPNHPVYLNSHDPLQISRGPMRMEPSRRPPQIPSNGNSPSKDRLENRQQRPPKANIHITSQLRDGNLNQRRTATSGTGSSNKANRILGKNPSYTIPMPKEASTNSLDAGWGPGESSQLYNGVTSEETSADESDTPEGESIPDAHFEEIRKRLELLSPKDDPSLTFLDFHSRNAAGSSSTKEYGSNAATFANSGPLPDMPSLSLEAQAPGQIAELEAPRAPSPVELEATQLARPIEMALPTPLDTEFKLHDIKPSLEKEQTLGAHISRPSSTSTRKRSIKARSLASLAASDIADLYATTPSPSKTQRPSMTAEEVEQLISAEAAERVLLRILQSLDNLKDLFAAAEVSRGFYRTFKRHELSLLRNALWRMSPAAWELREMSIPYAELENGTSGYKPNMYFRHYVRDLLTVVELKGMILDNCKSFLRADTISGLAGETDRSPLIDDAFWRVWTFCKIFGCKNNREDDIVGQMDWLKGGVLAKQQPRNTNTLTMTDEMAMNSVLYNPPRGFSAGNGDGLTAEELYDMTEIWNCLCVLVRGYHGKVKEARENGVFDHANIVPGDFEKENAILEEWTFQILTLAPATILDVTSPGTPTQSTFSRARSQGYTSWVPPTQGTSRSTFLKEAVSRVYQEKLAMQRPSLSNSPNSFSALPQIVNTPLLNAPSSPDNTASSRQRRAAHAAELKAQKSSPTHQPPPPAEERPMSNYPDVLARLEALNASSTSLPSISKFPSLTNKLSFRRPKVTTTSASKYATNIKDSPISPSDSSSTISSSRNNTSSRLSSFRGKFPKRSTASNRSREDPVPPSSAPQKPTSRGATRDSTSMEKLPVVPNSQATSVPPLVPRGPQVRDPVDLAVQKLIDMGFDEWKAKKALADTDTGNSIKFDKALAVLVKERERRKRLERLDRMG